MLPGLCRIRLHPSRVFSLRAVTTARISRRTMSSEKKQDPRVVEVTDVPCEDCKWVKLRKIRWQDQTGRDVSGLEGGAHSGDGQVRE